MNQQAQNELTDERLWTDRWVGHARRRAIPPSLERRLRWVVSRYWMRLFRKFIRIANCSTGDILEIGCAPGAMLEKLHWACPTAQLHGIDYSEEGLAMTRQLMAATGFEATLHCADVFEASTSRLYDLVFSVGVIEHFLDPVPMVRRHMHFCKPGGYVAVTVPNYSTPVCRRLFDHFDPDFLAIHNLSTMHTGRLRQIMEQAGLQDVQAGGSGPPLLHSYADPKKRFGKLYARSARVWNLAAQTVPFPPFWHFILWAIGRVPANTAG